MLDVLDVLDVLKSISEIKIFKSKILDDRH